MLLLCPRNTRWVSSATFHSRSDRSLEADSGRSFVQQSTEYTPSWWWLTIRRLNTMQYNENSQNKIFETIQVNGIMIIMKPLTVC